MIALPTALLVLLQLGPAAPALPSPRFAPLAAVIQKGIAQGVYPGAVVVIGRRDTVLFERGFGHLTWARTSPAPSAETTRWDLASLTKVVATMSSALVLVDRGRLDLDAPVARYLPRFTGEGRERVTVRMLLDHTSGLRAYLPLYRLAANREAALDLIFREPLVRAPGASAEYSDLNGILLGLVVEAVAGAPLDSVAAREVFSRLGMSATVFAPALPRGASLAPSRSVDGRPAPGRVDDANAFLLGGVAGHAGLFSTGADLARFAQTWLSEGSAPGGPWVAAAMLRQFVQPSDHSGTRALGWDTPDRRGANPSVYGTRAGPRTYGHTGWTGTMLWVDPVRDLFMVFLTNRSLDPRARRSITALRKLRTQLSDLVIGLAAR